MDIKAYSYHIPSFEPAISYKRRYYDKCFAASPFILAALKTSPITPANRLYVDDLITSEAARGQGVGGKLLDWLEQLAKAEQCKVIHLDSGVQRFRAHKFYLNRDMKITCHHFLKELG